jgi:hypothetical protein
MQFPYLVRGADGWWRLPQHEGSLPLISSAKMIKPR